MPNYSLLNCPFCDGRPYVENHHRAYVRTESTHVSFVRCRQCGAHGARFDHREYGRTQATAAAIEAWNRRLGE